MTQQRQTVLFVSFTFLTAAALATAILLLCGAGPRGVDKALDATARLAFVFFLPAYVGGSLVTVFGLSFLLLAKHGRDLGLAFASVEIVHLGLVARLCTIGAAPGRSTFILFGAAAFFVFLLAILSFKAFRRLLHPSFWWAVRLIGMNFIAYAFYVDLSRNAFAGGMVHNLYYAPFLLSLISVFLLKLVALSLKMLRRSPSPKLQ